MGKRKRKQIRPRPAQAVCLIEELIPSEHYSITDLCQYVNITRQAYYNILSGSSLPRVDVALRICDYINQLTDDGYTLGDLWTLKEIPQEDKQIPGQIPLDL